MNERIDQNHQVVTDVPAISVHVRPSVDILHICMSIFSFSIVEWYSLVHRLQMRQ
jgi:hypothetical protein